MRYRSFSRALTAGMVAVILALATVGAAFGQETPTPAPTPTAQPEDQYREKQEYYQRYLDALAARLGVTTDELRQAMRDARAEVPKPAGAENGHRQMMAQLVQHELEVAANAMGISADQLRQELPGNSLAGVATAHGVDPTVVSDALKADAHARIDDIIDRYMTYQFDNHRLDMKEDAGD